MFAFVHGPSGALHFETAAVSAPSCSGLPPVPRPTNHRTRIFPSEVSPPAFDGSAVTSAPVGRGVDDAADDGFGVFAEVHAPAITSAAMPSAIRVCQLFFMWLSRPSCVLNDFSVKTAPDAHARRSVASPPLEPRTMSSVARTTLRGTGRE